VNAFFDKLVRRKYATSCDCLHNRAHLYHVHHAVLYRAIGEPESRYRRLVSARQAVDRVMLLDGVLDGPGGCSFHGTPPASWPRTKPPPVTS
jgi:hypothetical protein